MLETFKYLSYNNQTLINAYIWKCKRKPKAILQCSHGMMEDALSFNELAEFLNSKDIAVCSNDLLGHGKSEINSKTFCNIKNDDAYLCPLYDMKKLHDIVKKRYPDISYFMLAFSLSSFTLRRFIELYSRDLSGTIIVGTGDHLRANVTATKVIKNVYIRNKDNKENYFSKYTDDKFIAEKYLINNPDNLTWFCIDKTTKIKILHTELWKYVYTIDSYFSFKSQFPIIDNHNEMKKISKKLPIIFLSGSNDILGNYGKVTTEIYNNYKNLGIKDISLKLYPGLSHPILQSKEKNLVMTDIYKWVCNYL